MSLLPTKAQKQIRPGSGRLRFDFGLLLAGQALNQGLTALAGLLVVRFLVPLEYSRYTLAVAGLNLGAIIADAGLSAYIGREAARLDEVQAGQLWRKALFLRVALSLLVWLTTILLTWVFPVLGEPGLALITGLALFPAGIAALTTAFLNARGFIPAGVGLNALNTLANFSLTILALFWLPEAAPLLAANVLAMSFAAGILGRKARRAVTPLADTDRVKVSLATSFQYLALLRASSGFMLIGLASVLFQYADIYLVSALLNRAEVGRYGAALRLLAIVTAIPTVWGIAALPRYVRRWQNQAGRNHLIQELKTWGWLLTGAGLAIALAGLFLTEPLVKLLLGPKYENVTGPLSLLWWSGAAIFASAAPVTYLTMLNQQHRIALALFLADGFGLGLAALVAGPLGGGLIGVALVRVATAWLLCGLYLYFARR